MQIHCHIKFVHCFPIDHWFCYLCSWTEVLILYKSAGRALEEIRGSLYNELRTSDGAKRQQQRYCGPVVAMTFNFMVAVGIIMANKLVRMLLFFQQMICVWFLVENEPTSTYDLFRPFCQLFLFPAGDGKSWI